jgi:general secretion pathway protein M
MNLAKYFETGKTLPPYVAAPAYVALVLVLLVGIAMSWTGVLGRRAAVEAQNDILMRLEGRSPVRAAKGEGAAAGSYFLEGPSVTVAGAALLQRVIGIVTQHGGSVLSSQLELQGTQSKDGFLTVIVSSVMEQPALQQTIYDVEAGLPFLFVDQLDVQAPQSSASAVGGKLRVLLSVSGQWQGAR